MRKYPTVQSFNDLRGKLVPLVASIIPRTGGWSGDNQLGYELPFQKVLSNQATVVKMDEWGPPVVWTMSLGIKEIKDNTLAHDIVAQIEFGVGGITQKLLCDWNSGAQVSVVANAINVIALYRGLSVGINADDDLRISVQLGRGSRPTSGLAPVYTLAKRVTLNAGAAARYALPPYAKAVRLLPSSTQTPSLVTAADVTAVFNANVLVMTLDNVIAGGVNAVIRGSDFLTVPSLPVLGGARFAEVLNGSAGAICYDLIAEVAA